MQDSPNLPVVPDPPASTKPVVIAATDRPAMISLQERLLERAIEAGASDLHIEPYPDKVRLRIRVDGWLHELDPLPRWMHEGLTARFKVLTEMDVTERRRPQDGRSTFTAAGVSVDLRAATLATRHGEKIVIRLLPRSLEPLGLEELGLGLDGLRRVRTFIDQPHGLILTAGPTGAGKTTTLYALARRIDAIGRNLVTLEDPIEYWLPDAVQVPVRSAIGVDFATALRAVLRQDPDVILIGEIRDEETARIAVRSATTGHLVMSSVHTNRASESACRLLELGVPGYLVAGALIGVISQRLVRRLCRRCRAPYEPPAAISQRLSLPPAGSAQPYFINVGCSACRAGFSGRVGLFEVLSLEPELRRYLADGTDGPTLEEESLKAGALLTLRASAMAALRSGQTSPEEIARVLPYEEGINETG